ncbi:hypothetical protein [Desertivirga arenae]
MEDNSKPAISLTLPKSIEAYKSPYLSPFLQYVTRGVK